MRTPACARRSNGYELYLISTLVSRPWERSVLLERSDYCSDVSLLTACVSVSIFLVLCRILQTCSGFYCIIFVKCFKVFHCSSYQLFIA